MALLNKYAVLCDNVKYYLLKILLNWNIQFQFSVDQVFREANISNNGMVNYEEFVKIVCAPVPDYYW